MTATINGERATRVQLHVPGVGAWWADVDLEEAPELSEAAVIALDGLELHGTVLPLESGTHVLERRVRVVGGAGGWSTLLPAKPYHNDASIRAATVIEDAAREAGETLGDVAPVLERLGIDYVRRAGPAFRVLEDAGGGAPWWVAYDGRTHLGERSTQEALAGSYEVVEFHARDRLVTLVVDDLSAVGIGSILSERLDEPQTVRELVIDVGPDQTRARAWCGGEAGSRGRLADALRAVIRGAVADPLFGSWRYRVLEMSSDRVKLQAVRQGAGLPDIQPVSMWPGLPGLHAELTPGALVLVEFIEGDRRNPIITHFAGKDGTGWTPANMTIDVTTLLKLGKDASSFAAKADLVSARLDTIQQAFDSHTHIGTATVSTGSVGTIAAPASPIGALASVAAAKVKVQ
jgi:hypothetical protein